MDVSNIKINIDDKINIDLSNVIVDSNHYLN